MHQAEQPAVRNKTVRETWCIGKHHLVGWEDGGAAETDSREVKEPKFASGLSLCTGLKSSGFSKPKTRWGNWIAALSPFR